VKVKAALEKTGLKLRVIDASEVFYSGTTTITKGTSSYVTKRLDQTVEPEEKRKIVGDTFVHVAQREIELLGLKMEDVFLAQGTLRPDLIESASHTVSSSASVIKTHHNDTNLIRQLRASGRVLEPLADYHKDEVRALGRDLGLPEDLVERSVEFLFILFFSTSFATQRHRIP
jgi:GMP synthase (glutamine-hydrolysing)